MLARWDLPDPAGPEIRQACDGQFGPGVDEPRRLAVAVSDEEVARAQSRDMAEFEDELLPHVDCSFCPHAWRASDVSWRFQARPFGARSSAAAAELAVASAERSAAARLAYS